MDPRLLPAQRAPRLRTELPEERRFGITARKHATAAFCANGYANWPRPGPASVTSACTSC